MTERLIAVLDETGTTNRPQLELDSDFGIGVVLFDPTRRTKLATASQTIGTLVRNADYKYKHVQRNTQARRAFIRAMNILTPPSGVFGFFTPGASLLNEKDRAIKEMEFLESDDGGGTAEVAEQIRNEDGDAHIDAFLGYFVSCIVSYAKAVNRRIEVYWDRRSDLERLQRLCQDRANTFRNHPIIGPGAELVAFDFVAEQDLAAIARLAGVLAGDVRFFFRKHGERIWSRCAKAVRVYGTGTHKEMMSLLQPDRFMQETRVATVTETLADKSFEEGNKETCLLQGYSKRFIRDLLSFASPQGMMGHILIRHGALWEVHQIPD
jgi:hypothetical protein